MRREFFWALVHSVHLMNILTQSDGVSNEAFYKLTFRATGNGCRKDTSFDEIKMIPNDLGSAIWRPGCFYVDDA